MPQPWPRRWRGYLMQVITPPPPQHSRQQNRQHQKQNLEKHLDAPTHQQQGKRSGDTLLSARISSLKSQREPSKAFTSRMLFLRLQHRSRLPERRTNVGRINPSHQRGIIGQPIAPCKLQLIRNSSFQLPAGIAADMLPGFDHNDELTISLKARRES